MTARTSTIESRSIDCVPASERHGKVWRQGPFWFLGNFQPSTLTRLAAERKPLEERETIAFRRDEDRGWLAVHDHLSPVVTP